MKNATLRQLRIFASVARHLSFIRAAEELRLTAPAVSMQIKELELEVGLPLFDRTSRQVSLTMVGEYMLAHTRRVLAASFTVRYEHAVPALAGADLRLTDLLTPRQWSFMQDCAPGPPQPGLMDPLGPIPVLSWTISLDRIDATMSRWRLPGTEGGTGPAPELAEVSRRSLPTEAGFLFPALAASMRRRGLDPDGDVPWLETRAAQWSVDRRTPAEQP
jgi:hypothetical protein